MHRSKSVPHRYTTKPVPEGDDLRATSPEYEITTIQEDKHKAEEEGSKPERKKKAGSRAKKEVRAPKYRTLADRPEWNSDARIEGYDYADEKRYDHYGEKRAGGAEQTSRRFAKQEELNKEWLDSLRDQFYGGRKDRD